MLKFLDAPVTRPESDVAKRFLTDTLEFIAWRHRAFDEILAVVLAESTLLATIMVSLVLLIVRVTPVMQGPGARAGGGGTLTLVMVAAIAVLALCGLRLFTNVKLIRKLNTDSFLLEERLGDDE
jgi:hypothetical protein